MLYMTSEDGQTKVIILETANLEEIRKGRPAKTPDGTVLLGWTPDPVWLAGKILESGGDGPTIAKLIEEAYQRPQQPVTRAYHRTHLKDFRQ